MPRVGVLRSTLNSRKLQGGNKGGSGRGETQGNRLGARVPRAQGSKRAKK